MKRMDTKASGGESTTSESESDKSKSSREELLRAWREEKYVVYPLLLLHYIYSNALFFRMRKQKETQQAAKPKSVSAFYQIPTNIHKHSLCSVAPSQTTAYQPTNVPKLNPRPPTTTAAAPGYYTSDESKEGKSSEKSESSKEPASESEGEGAAQANESLMDVSALIPETEDEAMLLEMREKRRVFAGMWAEIEAKLRLVQEGTLDSDSVRNWIRSLQPTYGSMVL